jgi:hypothetical protein
LKIHSCWDNQGRSFDRYTVYYKGRGSLEWRWTGAGKAVQYRQLRGMSENPFHPQGFGQWCHGMPGKHNGKRIAFQDLPADCQRLVARDLETTVEVLLEQNKPKVKNG